MEKKSPHGVYGVAHCDVRDRVVAALVIYLVADDGMINGREMNADLMRAAGFDLDIEQCEFFVSLANFP